MLFLSYIELNDNMPVQQALPLSQKALQAGLLESEGVKVIRFDGTPDNWGVITMEADSAVAVHRFVETLRAAMPGYVKLMKTSPALSAEEAIKLSDEVLQTVKQALSS